MSVSRVSAVSLAVGGGAWECAQKCGARYPPFSLHRARGGLFSEAALEAVLNVYRRMTVLLVRRGLPARRPAQTPREYLMQVPPLFSSGLDTVEWLTEATNAAAYDPSPFDSSMARAASDRLAGLPRTLAVKDRLIRHHHSEGGRRTSLQMPRG